MPTTNFNTLGDHPYVKTEIANDIEKGYWQKSRFDFYTGSGADRAIRQYKVDTIGPYIAKLKSIQTQWNANLNDYWYANTLETDVIGNALLSEIELYSKTKQIDFTKEAKENLIQWFTTFSDRSIIANITNNFTNIVCASANNASGIQEYTQGDTVQSMCAKVSAGDVCSVASIRKLIFYAKNGINYDGTSTFTIDPTSVSLINKGDVQFEMMTYLLFIDGYQAMQLKADPEWVQIQSIEHNRGYEHNFCTGFLGKIDGTWIIEMPTWSENKAGLLHSEVNNDEFMSYVNIQANIQPLSNYHGNNQATSIGFLLGANACIYANSGTVRLLQERKDSGRKLQVSADKIIGVGKTVYNGLKGNKNKLYHNKDFGVIGYITSRE